MHGVFGKMVCFSPKMASGFGEYTFILQCENQTQKNVGHSCQTCESFFRK